MSENEVVALSSDSDNEDKSTIESRVKLEPMPDHSRLSKKSATTDFKYSPLAKRQAAIVSEDKTKKLTRLLNSDSDISIENFVRENSSPEKRKLDKKPVRKSQGPVYDSNGVHIASGLDLCDCLDESCKGCHFPCPKCSSQKCGVDCRVNRKYSIEQIEYHGYDLVVKNPLFK